MIPKLNDKKLSNTCEKFKFQSWYDVAFCLGQEAHQICKLSLIFYMARLHQNCKLIL